MKSPSSLTNVVQVLAKSVDAALNRAQSRLFCSTENLHAIYGLACI
jgi:hypothetical protein